MKIDIISNLFPPLARGGAEIIAARIAHKLSRRGHRVRVLSTRPYDGFASWRQFDVERHVETVYRFCPPNFYYLLDDQRPSFPVRAAWHLVDLFSPAPGRLYRRLLSDDKPDVVLTHNLKGLGLQVVKEIRAHKIRHIHTIHDVQLSVPSGLLIYGEEDRWLNRSSARRWYERRMQSVFGSPDVVISPSRFLAGFYGARGFFPESRVEILPNPIPEAAFEPVGPRLDGPLRILFAGQLETHKGIVFLLETLNKLDIPFQLHIAGEGSLATHVTEWAERDPRVNYHGFVSLENLFNLFSICDVTVVPSLCYENSPTVITESFLAGEPVIASDIGGVGEMVRDGENGYLVTPGSTHELSGALKKFAAEIPSWRAKRAQIRQGIEPYRLTHYVDRLEKLLRE